MHITTALSAFRDPKYTATRGKTCSTLTSSVWSPAQSRRLSPRLLPPWQAKPDSPETKCQTQSARLSFSGALPPLTGDEIEALLPFPWRSSEQKSGRCNIKHLNVLSGRVDKNSELTQSRHRSSLTWSEAFVRKIPSTYISLDVPGWRRNIAVLAQVRPTDDADLMIAPYVLASEKVLLLKNSLRALDYTRSGGFRGCRAIVPELLQHPASEIIAPRAVSGSY